MTSLSREEKKQLARQEDASADILIQLSREDSEIRRLVAGNPNTPLQVLERFGVGYADEIVSNPVFDLLWLENSDSQFLKMCLAKASTTSPEVLEKLSCDRDYKIRSQVAKNPRTTANIFAKLVEDENYNVVVSLIENYSIQLNILEKLAKRHFHSILVSRILKHPNSSEEILLQAANSSGYNDRIAAAKCRKTPVDILIKLSQDPVSSIRREIAGNLRTPSDILIKLAKDPALRVIKAVARNPKTPASLLSHLANSDNVLLREAIAYNYKTPIENLIELSNDFAIVVRTKVAKNISTPVNILEKLATDESTFVIAGVAWNINTPRNLLIKLSKQHDFLPYCLIHNQKVLADIFVEVFTKEELVSKSKTTKNITRSQDCLDYDKIIRASIYGINLDLLIYKFIFDFRRVAIARVVSNPNLPQYILEKLAEHRYKFVRKLVATNPNTPADILEKLAEDPVEYVRKAVTENKNTPPQSLISLTKTVKNYSLRKAVKHHHFCDRDILISVLEKLANSSDWLDRKTAVENTQTPLSTLQKLQSDRDRYVRICAAKNIERFF